MRRFLGLLCVVPALAIVLWIVFGDEVEVPPSPEPPQAAANEVHAAEPAPPETLVADREPDRSEIAAAPLHELARAPEPRLALGEFAELRGRLLLEGGAPASGARVELHGWAGNNERVLKYGEPRDWQTLAGNCDADGRFAIRFDPPRAYQFVLETTYPGCVSAKWRWTEIEPATSKELGELVLPLGGAVTGRVVDSQGNPVREPWTVYAEGPAVASGEGSDASRGMARADPVTGEFRIENMPPGAIELKAHSQIANWIEGPTVQVRAGETIEADIRYLGPDNSRRITVVTFCRPFYVFSHDISGISLSAAGMKPRKAQLIANSSQSFCFDDLAPGSYSIAVDDPRFKPWHKDGVTPGQRVDVSLEGASAVRLAVVDAATQEPVERYALRVRFEHVNFSPNQFELFGPMLERPAGGLVEGLIPMDQTLIVLAEGYAPCELRIPDLQPGEARPLRAELSRGATLVARVVQADGQTPAPGLTVTLALASKDGSSAERSGAARSELASEREATSGPDGRVSFTSVAAGNYSLRAELTPQLCAELEQIEVAALDTRKSFELVLPQSGTLAGRVIGFEKAPLEGCTLLVLPAEATPDELANWEMRDPGPARTSQNRIAPDGTFSTGPLRPGHSIVRLQYPQVSIRYGQSSMSNMPGSTIELAEIDVPVGTQLQRDFDLQGRTAGKILADVRVQGTPAVDARVYIQSADDEQRNGAIRLDSQGRGTSGPIAPGLVHIQITAADGTWSWSPPGTWLVASGETLKVAWDIPLVNGSLQLVDDVSGIALAGRQVLVRRDTGGSFELFEVTADAQGRLQLQLVPAAYLLEFMIEIGRDGRRDPSPYESARFDWNANSPGNSVLRVRRRR